MGKLINFIVTAILATLGSLLLLPFIGGAVLVWASIRLRCWVNGKHTYNPQHLLLGIPLQALCCAKCYKPISKAEYARVQAEIDVYFMGLKQSQEFLNSLFKTPEEQAIDKLIDETKN